MLGLGASLLDSLLALDRGHRGPRIECGHGHQARFVGYRPKQIDTVLGLVRIQRAYYHCSDCAGCPERDHGVFPRDIDLDIVGSSLTPGLRAMIDRAAGSVPFAQATRLLTELSGICLDTKRVERVAEADGLAADAEQHAHTKAVLAGQARPLPPPRDRDGNLPDKLYIAVDGTGVPMRPSETKGRAGKDPSYMDGRARTREVKLAALFTQTRRDEEGRPIRDPDSTSYLATFEPAEKFGALVKAAALTRGHDQIRQTIILGDGARWIWNLADARLPGATQIVDIFHAREHLVELVNMLAFLLPDPKAWLAARQAELDAGNIEAISAAVRDPGIAGVLSGPKTKAVDTAMAYFETNTHRMRYQHFQDLGMFIGSGVVEAGCKAVIGARLKQSGMHWTTRGATGITTLRCQAATTAA